MKKIVLLLLFLLNCTMFFAQETQIRSNENHYFEDGKNLFSQQKYGASKQQFELFLNNADPNSGIYANAKYYIACCSYELNDPNTDEILRDFLNKYPYYPMQKRVTFMLGRLYFEQKNYKQAQSYLAQIEPSDLNAHEADQYYFANGFCLLQNKKYEDAKHSFFRIKSNEYLDDKIYYYAYCDYSLGNYNAALQGFEKCRFTKYEEASLYHSLQIYYHTGNDSKATKVGKELIDKYPNNPNNSEAFRILGETSYKNGNFTDAVTYLSQYEKIAKKVIREDMYILGISFEKTGNCQQSIKYLSKTTTKNDDMAQNSYHIIGQCYLKQNDIQNAKMAFQAAYSKGTDAKIKEEALYNYALATYQSGSLFGESSKAFNTFLDKYPQSSHVDRIQNLLASAYLSETDYDQAIKSINTIKRPNKKILQVKEYILFRSGVKEFNNKRYNKAIELFDESIKLYDRQNSLSPQAFLWRGESYFKQKDYDRSRSDLMEFVKQAPDDAAAANACYTIGYSYFNQERFGDAIEWFNRYKNIETGKKTDSYFDAINRIGDSYFYTRNFTNASNAYSEVIASNSANADYALYQKAFIKSLQKEYSSSIADMEKLTKYYPASEFAPKAQYEKGRGYVMQKKYEEAIREYDVLLEKYPQNSIAKKAALEIAMLYDNMGQTNDAINAYKRVVALYPGSEQTNVALESMQNLYVDKNDIDSYLDYTKSLDGNTAILVTASKEDSLSYIAAEKVYSKKEYKEAITSFNNYIFKFCNDAVTVRCIDANYYLADSYYEIGNMLAALEKYSYLTKIEGNEYMETALIRAADIAYSEKQYEQAVSYFATLKQVTSVQDIKDKAQLGILRCYFHNKNYEMVIDNATIILNKQNEQEIETEARFSRAKAYIEIGDFTSAIPDLIALKSDVSNSMGAESSYLLAKIYFDQNQYTQSEDEVLNFIGKKSPFQYWIARNFILLSDIYMAQKDDFQAKQYLLTLRENYTTNDDVSQMIQDRLSGIEARESDKLH